MLCPIDSTSGFIKLNSVITTSSIEQIKQDIHSLTITPDPSKAIRSLNKNRINEDNSSNKLIYNNVIYTLIDVQITKLVHEGYRFPGNTSQAVAELILTYGKNNTDPTGVLLCFPIYTNSNRESNASYLKQISLDNMEAGNQGVGFASLFPNDSKSLAYKTCFDTSFRSNNRNQTNNYSLYVVVFPDVIFMTNTDFLKLKTKIIGTQGIDLPQYAIPPGLRNVEDTVVAYKIVTENNKGVKEVTETSRDGIIYSSFMSCNTDEFNTKFEYFSKPPEIATSSGQRRLESQSCPYYKTTQYKCVPLNKATDLSGNYVIPGNKTLDKVLSEEDELVKKQLTSAKGGDITSLTTEDILGISAGIVGITLAGIVLLKVNSWLSKNE